MRNRTLSDLILAIALGLCVAAVAGEHRQPTAEIAIAPAAIHPHSVADGARALAMAVLWSRDANEQAAKSMRGADRIETPVRAADTALEHAALAAGRAASSVDMPFISFGGAAE